MSKAEESKARMAFYENDKMKQCEESIEDGTIIDGKETLN